MLAGTALPMLGDVGATSFQGGLLGMLIVSIGGALCLVSIIALLDLFTWFKTGKWTFVQY